jgi:4'-phosphopantetheinyl transferase
VIQITLYRNSETICSVSSDQTCNLSIKENEIHVWIAELDQSVNQVREFEEILALEERRRAERFHFENDRNRFIVGHGILRRILGRYLGIEPCLLKFFRGAFGKLYLPNDLNSRLINFNISHSGTIALFAFTRNREIGVDVEKVRPIANMDQISKLFFSKRENTVFQMLPSSQKTKAFYNCWVRKEAFIKAMGMGMFRPLDTFEVSLVPGKPAKLLSNSEKSRAASRWTIYDIRATNGYVSAIAVGDQSFWLCKEALRN